MLAAQRASRRASNQEASASGRQERAPEDDVFERFNSLLDDWVVTLMHYPPPVLPDVISHRAVKPVHKASCSMNDTRIVQAPGQEWTSIDLLVQLVFIHSYSNATAILALDCILMYFQHCAMLCRTATEGSACTAGGGGAKGECQGSGHRGSRGGHR